MKILDFKPPLNLKQVGNQNALFPYLHTLFDMDNFSQYQPHWNVPNWFVFFVQNIIFDRITNDYHEI